MSKGIRGTGKIVAGGERVNVGLAGVETKETAEPGVWDGSPFANPRFYSNEMGQHCEVSEVSHFHLT